jgi:hypothetical protein
LGLAYQIQRNVREGDIFLQCGRMAAPFTQTLGKDKGIVSQA